MGGVNKSINALPQLEAERLANPMHFDDTAGP
jgi:hypothetical protein